MMARDSKATILNETLQGIRQIKYEIEENTYLRRLTVV